MYGLLLLIKDLHLAIIVEAFSGSLVYAVATWLFVAFLNHRRIRPIVWLLLATLGLADAAFMWSLDSGTDSHGSIITAEFCVGVWFFIIPMLLRTFGFYDDAYPRIRRTTMMWWLGYSFTFLSLMLTLFGIPMLCVHSRAAVSICGYALISWIVTFVIYSWNGSYLFLWLLNKLRSFKLS
jgi:hypothetical protein